MYSWDVPDTVLLDSAAARGWPLENILGAKIHERGVCSMDFFTVRGFKVGEVGPVNHIIQLTPYVVPGSTKLKEGRSKVLVIDSPGVNDSGIYITGEASDSFMHGTLNRETWYTKKQLDSAYRKGVRDERKRFGYILDDGANSPGPMQTNGWTKLMELADTLHPHNDTTSFRKWNEMLDSSRNGFIEKPSPTRALLLRIKNKIPTFNMDSGRIILDVIKL